MIVQAHMVPNQEVTKYITQHVTEKAEQGGVHLYVLCQRMWGSRTERPREMGIACNSADI